MRTTITHLYDVGQTLFFSYTDETGNTLKTFGVVRRVFGSIGMNEDGSMQLDVQYDMGMRELVSEFEVEGLAVVKQLKHRKSRALKAIDDLKEISQARN